MFQKTSCPLLIAVLLIGCSANIPAQTTAELKTPAVTMEPAPTERSVALRVNGEGIWMEEYQASMQQIQHAQTELDLTFTDAEASNRVVNELVQTALFAQEAYANGFILDEAAIQQEILDISNELGGDDAFNSWLSENGYTREVFIHAYKKSEAAAWQIEQITAAVPITAEQIHARQILTSSRANAEEALQKLNNGYDFETLANVYDPLTGGDLNWFPRGYLLQPLLEEAAFNLEVGEYSDIIETTSGFHIIYVIEREMNRVLSQDALLTLQDHVLKQWMDDKVSSSTIEIFVP